MSIFTELRSTSSTSKKVCDTHDSKKLSESPIFPSLKEFRNEKSQMITTMCRNYQISNATISFFFGQNSILEKVLINNLFFSG